MEIMLKKVRLSFPVLVTPEAFPGTTKERYSATFLVTPGSEADKAIQAAIAHEAKAAWPKNTDAMLESFRGNSNKYCYVKGDTKSYDGYQGMLALTGHRYKENGAPLLLDNQNDDRTGKLRVLTGEEGRIYAGCYVNAKVQIYAQTKTYPGIRCGLLVIQYDSPGDAFSGSSRPTDEGFETLEDTGEQKAGASLV